MKPTLQLQLALNDGLLRKGQRIFDHSGEDTSFLRKSGFSVDDKVMTSRYDVILCSFILDDLEEEWQRWEVLEQLRNRCDRIVITTMHLEGVWKPSLEDLVSCHEFVGLNYYACLMETPLLSIVTYPSLVVEPPSSLSSSLDLDFDTE